MTIERECWKVFLFTLIFPSLWFCLQVVTFSYAIVQKDEAPDESKSLMISIIILSCPLIPLPLLGLVCHTSYRKLGGYICLLWYSISFLGCFMCALLLKENTNVKITVILNLVYGGVPITFNLLGFLFYLFLRILCEDNSARTSMISLET